MPKARRLGHKANSARTWPMSRSRIKGSIELPLSAQPSSSQYAYTAYQKVVRRVSKTTQASSHTMARTMSKQTLRAALAIFESEFPHALLERDTSRKILVPKES